MLPSALPVRGVASSLRPNEIRHILEVFVTDPKSLGGIVVTVEDGHELALERVARIRDVRYDGVVVRGTHPTFLFAVAQHEDIWRSLEHKQPVLCTHAEKSLRNSPEDPLVRAHPKTTQY